MFLFLVCVLYQKIFACTCVHPGCVLFFKCVSVTLEVVSVSFAIFVAMQSVMGRSIFNPHHSEDAWNPNPQIPLSTLWNNYPKGPDFVSFFEEKNANPPMQKPTILSSVQMDVIIPQSSSTRGFLTISICLDSFQQLLIKANISFPFPNPNMVLAGNINFVKCHLPLNCTFTNLNLLDEICIPVNNSLERLYLQ